MVRASHRVATCCSSDSALLIILAPDPLCHHAYLARTYRLHLHSGWWVVVSRYLWYIFLIGISYNFICPLLVPGTMYPPGQLIVYQARVSHYHIFFGVWTFLVLLLLLSRRIVRRDDVKDDSCAVARELKSSMSIAGQLLHKKHTSTTHACTYEHSAQVCFLSHAVCAV